MTRTVATTELKAKLSEILGDVERGEAVEITRRGRTIAHILPKRPVGNEEVDRAIAELRRLRDSLPKVGITVEEILDARHAGHRY